MMTKMEEGLTQWHQMIADTDFSGLRELLAENVKFHSPVLWKPKEGREMVFNILRAAGTVLEGFTYHRQMTDGFSWTLEFSAHVGELSVKGVDIIRFNSDGKIEEFEVMVRPATGLQALGAAMAKQLSTQQV